MKSEQQPSKKPDAELSEWLAAPGECEESTLPITMGQAISDSAAKWGDREAVVYRHQPAVDPVAWTYAELDHLSSRLAAVLLDMDFRQGERIAIWGPNHAEWILLEYALAKAGLVLVALNPLYRKAELAFALTDSDAAGLFHADTVGQQRLESMIAEVRPSTPRLRHVHSFSSIWDDLLRRDCGPLPTIEVAPDATCMIQYTSGTTGVPRAARISHQAIATTGHNSYRRWRLGEQSRVCFGFPLFHVGGSGNSVPGCCTRGATALPLHIFKPDIALDVIERERCTSFIGVPTMVIAMLEHPSVRSRDLSAMESVIIGGAPVTHDLLHRCRDVFGAEVINGYGQTETCGVTTGTCFADSAAHKTETSGQPLEGVSVSVRNNTGDTVRHGEIGELHYRGPGGMTGYGSREDDPNVGDDWIASGDLAQMDTDGFVRIVGRKKEMIIRGGENLSPLEIEDYMKAHEAIGDVAVIGLPDRKYGEVACAVVRRLPGHDASAEDIRAWCAERISRWKVPEYVEFVDELPLTPSGKIKKYVLQEMISKRLGLDLKVEQPVGEEQ